MFGASAERAWAWWGMRTNVHAYTRRMGEERVKGVRGNKKNKVGGCMGKVGLGHTGRHIQVTDGMGWVGGRYKWGML